MKENAWETRLLGILAAVLIVVGLVSVYGASSLVNTQGGVVGASYFFKQAIGAAIGGLGATILARTDYHVWQRWAWPLLGLTLLLLIIPVLPFTRAIAPILNGARRWVNLGFTVVQPSELAKFTLVCWTAMLAAKKGENVDEIRNKLNALETALAGKPWVKPTPAGELPAPQPFPGARARERWRVEVGDRMAVRSGYETSPRFARSGRSS